MKVYIVGMGALGVMYADYIKEHGGDVSFVMNEERLLIYQDKPVVCNGREQVFSMVDEEKAGAADLVIVAVKYNGLKPAIQTMKNCIGKDTIIMSVMNGISSEDIIAGTYGSEKLIYTVAQGMDAMKAGNRLKYTQMGELCIGSKEKVQAHNVEQVAAYFESIGMPYTADKDIMHRIWGKFMLNVGVNQTCMAYGTTYEGVLKPGEAHDMMLQAMREVIAAANAEGIALGEEDLEFYVGLLKKLDPDGYPSMAQDRVARRPSEVEMFAGTVIPVCERHGIPAPANRKLYEMVKAVEEEYA